MSEYVLGQSELDEIIRRIVSVAQTGNDHSVPFRRSSRRETPKQRRQHVHESRCAQARELSPLQVIRDYSRITPCMK